jgi:predicted phosphodiesterase
MVKLVPYLESENIDLGRLSGADAEVVRWLVPQYDAQQVMLEHALVLNAWFAEQAADFRTRYPSWTCVLPRIYLTHGTIKASSDDWHNLLGYIIEAEPARDSFRYLHKIGEGLARIIVVGHSHLPMFWRCNVGENINAKWEIDHVLYAHSESENFKRFQLVGTKYNSSEGIELGDTEKYPVIINPGSVGQPRDKIPLSAYAILDLEQDRVYFRRVEYDIAAVQKDMRHYKDFKFPTGFIERLAKGE